MLYLSLPSSLQTPWKLSFSALAHLLLGCFFACCWILRVICTFWLTVFYWIYHLQIFSLILWLVFSLSWPSSTEQKGMWQWSRGKHQFSSVQLSCSVMSDTSWAHGLRYTWPPCPSPAPGADSKSWPSSQWCHPTILSSVILFSSCFQSFSASGSFQMSQYFTSGGQNIRVSASVSVFPMNIQDWLTLGLTGWISLQSKGITRVFSTPWFKSINSSALSFLYSPTFTYIHNYWKNHSFV